MRFILYPAHSARRKGQDFTGVKKVTVPNQTLSLKDILQRFIRKESLPINHDGEYVEDHPLGDLEKFSRSDISVLHDTAQNVKESIRKSKASLAEKAKAEDELFRKEVAELKADYEKLKAEKKAGGGLPHSGSTTS